VPKALIAHMKLVIAKLRRETVTASLPSAAARCSTQLELQLEGAGSRDQRERPSPPRTRRPARAHPYRPILPRERVIIPAPARARSAAGRPGQAREDITETLENRPRANGR